MGYQPGGEKLALLLLVLIILGGLGVGLGLRAESGGRRKLFKLCAIVAGGALLAQIALLLFLGHASRGPSRALVLGVLGFGICVVIGKLVAFLVFPAEQERFSDSGVAKNPVNAQDRQMVLDMLRDGKVSGEQGAELLKALGPAAGPADRLPMTKAVVGAVGGAMLVIIGFMLPWFYVRMPSMFGGASDGYQAGYHVGFLGWLILILGIVPALLVCIPSLDKHVRLGLLHIVIACIGGAFVISLLVKSPSGIGLWVAGVGFGLQLLAALGRVGFAGASARR